MRFVQERIQFHPLTQDVTERMSVTPAKVSLAAPPTDQEMTAIFKKYIRQASQILYLSDSTKIATK